MTTTSARIEKVRELEDAIIETIYAGLLVGKMDQRFYTRPVNFLRRNHLARAAWPIL